MEAMSDDLLRWGFWVYKTQSVRRGDPAPKVFSGWKRYHMWINKGTLYYGSEEGKPDKSIPIAACRGAERYSPEEFVLRKGRDAPTMLSDFAWILKTVDKTIVFVSDSESQCMAWVDGINAMMPRGHQRSHSGYTMANFALLDVSLSPAHGAMDITPTADSLRLDGPVSAPNMHRRTTSDYGGATSPAFGSTSPVRHGRSNSMFTFGAPEETHASPNGRGFSQSRRMTSALEGALVPLSSPAQTPLGPCTEAQFSDESLSDVVAMGTYVQKIKGDNADKPAFGSAWSRRFMWMEETILWYGAEKNKKERSIAINRCESIERLSDEDMFQYKAPTHLFRFGLRLRAAGKCWVFACESEVATQGWFRVWRRMIPRSTEELALEVHHAYEANVAQERFLEQQHKAAEEKRRKDAERKKAEEERIRNMTQIMAQSLLAAAKVQEEARRESQRKETKNKADEERRKKEDAVRQKREAEQRGRELAQKKEEEERYIAAQIAKRTSNEPDAPQYKNDEERIEAEIQRRIQSMRDTQQRSEEIEKEKRAAKEKEDHEKADKDALERRRLQEELAKAEASQIALLHEAELRRNSKEKSSCCVVS